MKKAPFLRIFSCVSLVGLLVASCSITPEEDKPAGAGGTTTAAGTDSVGAGRAGASGTGSSGGAESRGAESGGAESGGAESGGAESGGAESGGDGSGAAGTPTTSQCVPTPMAAVCAGKCGTVSNRCDGTYACGSCSSSSLPICVANACKQCAQVSDCPSGSFNCSSNKCVCRVPNSANVIKDGGFDSASTLNGWTSTQTTWVSTDDADGCPPSGSMAINGSISRCFQVAQVPAGGVEYSLGLKYKTDDAAGCFGSFYQDSKCTLSAGTADFLNLATDVSSSWAPSLATSQAPEGTLSIQVTCNAGGSTLNIDQIFLRVSGPSGSGF